MPTDERASFFLCLNLQLLGPVVVTGQLPRSARRWQVLHDNAVSVTLLNMGVPTGIIYSSGAGGFSPIFLAPGDDGIQFSLLGAAGTSARIVFTDR